MDDTQSLPFTTVNQFKKIAESIAVDIEFKKERALFLTGQHYAVKDSPHLRDKRHQVIALKSSTLCKRQPLSRRIVAQYKL
ncbi:MAG: hypothetical protein LH481_00590 [Burkholderiales bacterium]|nr:hypothetical protein [Burkholderiales bacterium]